MHVSLHDVPDLGGRPKNHGSLSKEQVAYPTGGHFLSESAFFSLVFLFKGPSFRSKSPRCDLTAHPPNSVTMQFLKLSALLVFVTIASALPAPLVDNALKRTGKLYLYITRSLTFDSDKFPTQQLHLRNLLGVQTLS